MTKRVYEAWGYTATLSQWAKMFEIEVGTLYKRIEKGMPMEAALSKRLYEHSDGRKWTHNGETHGSKEWAEILGLTQAGFLDRVRANLPEEKLFSPVDLRVKHTGKQPTRIRRQKPEDGIVTMLVSNALSVAPSVKRVKASEIGRVKKQWKYTMVVQ